MGHVYTQALQEVKDSATTDMPVMEARRSESEDMSWYNPAKYITGILDPVLEAIPDEIAQPLRPMAEILHPTTIEARTAPDKVRTYNEGMNWGGADWFGRMSLGTVVAQYTAAAAEGGEWGSDEHVELVSRGEDLFSLWDRIEDAPDSQEATWLDLRTGLGAKSLGYLARGASHSSSFPVLAAEVANATLTGRDINWERVEKAGDFVAAMGLTFVDPDIFGFAGGAVKASKKGVKALMDSAPVNSWKAAMGGAKHAKTQKVYTNASDNLNNALDAGSDRAPIHPVAAQRVADQAFQDVEDSLGKGARANAEALYKVVLQESASASEATRKAVEGAQRASKERVTFVRRVQEAKEEVAKFADTFEPSDAVPVIQDKIARLKKVEANVTAKLTRATDELLAGAPDEMREALDQTRSQLQGHLSEVTSKITALKDQEKKARGLTKALNAQKGMKARTALVEYTSAAADLLAVRAMRADMKATIHAARMMGGVAKTTPGVTADTAGLQARLKALQTRDLEEYIRAQEDLSKWLEDLANEGGLEAMNSMEVTLKALDVQEEKALKAFFAKHKQAELNGLGKADVGEDILRKDAVLKGTKGLDSRAKRTAPNRALQALSVTLRRMGDAHGEMGDALRKGGLDSMDEATRGLLQQEGQARHMAVAATRNPVVRYAKSLLHIKNHIRDPLAILTGSENEIVGTVYKGGMAISDNYKNGVGKALNGAARGKEELAIVDFLDSAIYEGSAALEHHIIQAGHVDTDLTPHDHAWSLIHRMAFEPEVYGTAFLDDFALAWLPQEKHSNMITVPRLKKEFAEWVKDNPRASFKEAMEGSRGVTARVLGGEVRDPASIQATMRTLAKDSRRAHILASQSISAAGGLAAAHRDMAVRAAGFTDEVVDAIYHLSDGNTHMVGEQLEEVISTLSKLDMPLHMQEQARGAMESLAAGYVSFGGRLRKTMLEHNIEKAGKAMMKDAKGLKGATKAAKETMATVEKNVAEGRKGKDILQGLSDETRKAVRTEILDDLELSAQEILEHEAYFLPRRFHQHFATKAGNLVKSGDAFLAHSTQASKNHAAGIVGNLLKIWNAGLLGGALYPQPGYYLMMQVGNVSQVYATMGVGEAALYGASVVAGDIDAMIKASPTFAGKPQGMWRSAKGSVDKYIPNSTIIHRATDLVDGALGAMPAMAEGVKKRWLKGMDWADDKLPSLMGSLMSRSASMFFDTDYTNATRIQGAMGAMTLGELRQEAVRRGVMSSFMQTGMMGDAFIRSATRGKYEKGNPVAFVSQGLDAWVRHVERNAEFFNAAEQRQRVAKFMHLRLNKGYTADEAADAVKHAFYDWEHPMTDFEADFLRKIFMFYTFQRKMMGQTVRHLLDPKTGMHNEASRALRVARGTRGLRVMSDQYMEDMGYGSNASYARWTKDANSRIYFGMGKYDSNWRRTYKREGKETDHFMYSVPAPTVFGGNNMMLDIMKTTSLFASGHISQGVQRGLLTTASMMGPSMRGGMKGFMSAMGLSEASYYGVMKEGEDPEHTKVLVRPTDKLLFSMLGHLPWAPVTKKGDRVMTSRNWYEFYRMALPFLSVELSRLGDTVMDPALQEGLRDDPHMYLLNQLGRAVQEHQVKAQ
jgi:hypothetical protein